MKALEDLAACAGTWRGSNRLQDPTTNTPDESRSTLSVISILAGRFVRIDYTWSYRGSPQEGSLLIGCDPRTGAVSAHWIDTWHMGDKAMMCAGAVSETGELSVRGSYSAGEGPEWGWRISIAPGVQRLRMVMFNIDPGGREELAVESEYARLAAT